METPNPEEVATLEKIEKLRTSLDKRGIVLNDSNFAVVEEALSSGLKPGDISKNAQDAKKLQEATEKIFIDSLQGEKGVEKFVSTRLGAPVFEKFLDSLKPLQATNSSLLVETFAKATAEIHDSKAEIGSLRTELENTKKKLKLHEDGEKPKPTREMGESDRTTPVSAMDIVHSGDAMINNYRTSTRNKG